MKRKTNLSLEKSSSARLICPHCRSGHEGGTFALFWEVGDRCWRCVICGYRSFSDGMPTARIA